MLSAFFLGWAIAFWTMALLSYFLRFSSFASTAFVAANALGVISLLLALLYFILRAVTKPRVISHQENLPQSRLTRLASRLLYWPYSSE